jgi:hypothetical protein
MTFITQHKRSFHVLLFCLAVAGAGLKTRSVEAQPINASVASTQRLEDQFMLDLPKAIEAREKMFADIQGTLVYQSSDNGGSLEGSDRVTRFWNSQTRGLSKLEFSDPSRPELRPGVYAINRNYGFGADESKDGNFLVHGFQWINDGRDWYEQESLDRVRVLRAADYAATNVVKDILNGKDPYEVTQLSTVQGEAGPVVKVDFRYTSVGDVREIVLGYFKVDPKLDWAVVETRITFKNDIQSTEVKYRRIASGPFSGQIFPLEYVETFTNVSDGKETQRRVFKLDPPEPFDAKPETFLMSHYGLKEPTPPAKQIADSGGLQSRQLFVAGIATVLAIVGLGVVIQLLRQRKQSTA